MKKAIRKHVAVLQGLLGRVPDFALRPALELAEAGGVGLHHLQVGKNGVITKANEQKYCVLCFLGDSFQGWVETVGYGILLGTVAKAIQVQPIDDKAW